REFELKSSNSRRVKNSNRSILVYSRIWILSDNSLPRLFRGNEKYENLTRPQSIEQICDSESLNLGINHNLIILEPKLDDLTHFPMNFKIF
nr:hypothetical protein [Salinivirgaceae bacterium]